jgi:hypothetical protein
VLPNLNEQLLPRKQSAVSFDLEVETKFEDKVAHFHIPFIGGIEVELDHVALNLHALFYEVPNSPNGFSNHFFKICEINGLCKCLIDYEVIQLNQDRVLLE